MLRWLVLAILCLSFAAAAAPKTAMRASGQELPALDAAARDLCGKRVALLGENGFHGDGKTPAFKSALIQRLVERCGFKAVFFEASHYDFLALERALRQGRTIEAAQLSSAIGWLWNHDVEMQPLIAFLTAEANRRAVTLGGLDDQVGARDMFYSIDLMPAELAGFLPEPRRGQCRESMHRRVWSDYSAAFPHDEQAVASLHACLAEIDRTIAADPALDGASRGALRQMAANFERDIARDFVRGPAYIQGRDRSMYLNFRWLTGRLPHGTKIIVWAENAHIAKDARQNPDYGDAPNLGALVHRDFGSHAFALGFSAAGGSFRWSAKEARPIPPAPAGSLEANALAETDAETAYIGPSRLAALGVVPGGALKDHISMPARWDALYDGMIVFRRERPPHRLDR